MEYVPSFPIINIGLGHYFNDDDSDMRCQASECYIPLSF